MLCEFKTVKGHELGVKETWNGGVENVVYQPKTYFLFPGFSQEIYTYDMSQQVSTMTDYRVQSQEGQDLKIDATLQWRRDAMKLVNQHKTVRDKIDEKVIFPIMMRIIKDEATAKRAIDVYSGNGLVELQAAIQRHLSDPKGELAEKGVLVENFVVRHIELDQKYIDEIKGKQIATQRTLRAKEEQIAAEAEALVAKSKAQADYNEQVVRAERDKQKGILDAERQARERVLAAEADAKKVEMAAAAEQKKLSWKQKVSDKRPSPKQKVTWHSVRLKRNLTSSCSNLTL